MYKCNNAVLSSAVFRLPFCLCDCALRGQSEWERGDIIFVFVVCFISNQSFDEKFTSLIKKMVKFTHGMH